MIYKRRFVIAAASSALALAAQAQAQEAENEPLEQVVVTGTRVANRSALDTAVPVDVVTGEQLQNLGVTEVSQALSVACPRSIFRAPASTTAPTRCVLRRCAASRPIRRWCW